MSDLRDPLDYTEDELYALSVEELQILMSEAQDLESMFNTKQVALKLLINSLYGALANRWFPLFNEDIAAAITGNGRFFIQKLAKYVEESLQNMHKSDIPYIVYGDTDSIYYHIEPFMNMYKAKNPGLSIGEYVDWADSFEKKVIEPIFKKCIADFALELNAYNADVIGVEREIIADSAVFIAKKKYLARVRDSEGTRYPDDDPYIKVMGLDVIKSGTPIWSKKKLKEAIPHILDKDEKDLKEWVSNIKREFTQVDINDIAMVGGVSRLDYDLNGNEMIPFGSKAAIYHNEYIKKKGLDKKYAPIQPSEKCKRLHLVTPNPIGAQLIAYTNEQFVDEIRDYIDYDTQFEKGFLSLLEGMTKTLGYDLYKKTSEIEDDW